MGNVFIIGDSPLLLVDQLRHSLHVDLRALLNHRLPRHFLLSLYVRRLLYFLYDVFIIFAQGSARLCFRLLLLYCNKGLILCGIFARSESDETVLYFLQFLFVPTWV